MTSGQVAVLLLGLAIILVLPHTLGAAMRLLGQPAVVTPRNTEDCQIGTTSK